ncbi:MAG: exodeoxyribonuclease VII large subunit [Actinomycetia bacterium]|nr:exodeoxyribonuclease VII large subunit [Actinomycetes bacterium]
MAETLTVRDLCSALSAAIDTTFPDEVWVKGAISGLTRSVNEHVYFDLVEPSDDLGTSTSVVLPVALFAANKHRVNAILRKSGAIRMHDGLEIRIRGQIAYYPPQGRVQMVMSLIDPSYTMGQMALARQALLDRLRADGLLEANGALELPALPLRIGLVTSEESAAHADFVHELGLSGYDFTVSLFDARVQGLDAVVSLAAAIEQAGRAAVDMVAVVRGGGAKIDLAAFDSEQVARAIATCPYPVVVGVGHEVDRSVADEVASVSAKTPTAAAAVFVEGVRHFDNEVAEAADRLSVLASQLLEGASHNLATAGHQLVAAASRAMDRHGNLLDSFVTHLNHRSQRTLDRAEAGLDHADVRLEALNPAAALARGWSITNLTDGTLVRRPADAPTGSIIVTTTALGRLVSTVTEVDPPADDEGSVIEDQ